MKVSKIYWFSDKKYTLFSHVPVTWYPIATIEQFPRDYNKVILKTLPEICSEDFVLIVQNDGYAVNADSWTNDFFNYDYIGAVWPYQQMHHIFPGLFEKYQDGYRVGNGGFSLRSKKLMQALLNFNWPNHYWDQNEDHIICNDFRLNLENDYGIKYAPAYVADQFSIEWNTSSRWLRNSFGFDSTRMESLYNPALLQLPIDKHNWQKSHIKTLLFCTGYAKNTQVWNDKYLSWIKHHLHSPLDYNQMLIVDDCSPCLPEWCNVHIQQADYNNAGFPIVLHRFPTRAGEHNFLSGWWRSFGYALKYAITNNFSRVMHIEADAQLVSANAYQWFNSVNQGWAVLWCPKHNFPEAAFQIISEDQLASSTEFFQTPYEDHAPVKTCGLVPEDFLPFTVINKDLKGDRYSEYPISVPNDIDFVAQLYG